MMTRQEKVNYFLGEIEKLKIEIEQEEPRYKINSFLCDKISELKHITLDINEDKPDFFKNNREFEITSYIANKMAVSLIIRVNTYNH